MANTKINWEEKYLAMSTFEDGCRARGLSLIAGVDEAGRGPLAGPVCAAAVILDPNRPVFGVDDSKKLSPARRAALRPLIIENAIAYSVVMVDAETIDRINILQATKLAMQKAIESLSPSPEIILIDALTIDAVPIEQMGIIKGDAQSVSIASASILAKETRDELMKQYDEMYPEYGFAHHKGYGTAEHINAIRQYGPLPIHRQSFIKKFI